MAVEFKKSWTEADVMELIGQSESIRREFKAGVMFDNEPESKWVETLAKEVSALANTEGGELILGIKEEKKSKLRIASAVDGVPLCIAPERLQQLIEGNLSPYLPGMRVHRVKLSTLADRVVYVIQVPQGNTAYQANDRRYYGRSEFEAKPLPDHEVRLRMQRGRIPQARLELASCKHETADQRSQIFLKRKRETDAERTGGFIIPRLPPGSPSYNELREPRQGFDECTFRFTVVNTGELTIRDFVLAVRLVSHDDRSTIAGKKGSEIGVETRFRFFRAAEMETADLSGKSKTIQRKPEEKLFPGDRILFPDQTWTLEIRNADTLGVEKLLAEWTIFLEDTAPVRGTLDLGLALQRIAPTESDD